MQLGAARRARAIRRLLALTHLSDPVAIDLAPFGDGQRQSSYLVPHRSFLDESQLHHGLGGLDPLDLGQLIGEHAEQVLVVLADDLADHVESPGRDHDVGHFLQGGDRLGHPFQVRRVHVQADEGRLPEAHRQRIGDPHHLDDAATDQPLRSLADRRLRHLQLPSDLRVRAAAVQLEGLDDRLVQVVEERSTP